MDVRALSPVQHRVLREATVNGFIYGTQRTVAVLVRYGYARDPHYRYGGGASSARITESGWAAVYGPSRFPWKTEDVV